MTLGGGQGRSARLKERGVPPMSKVDSRLGSRDSVEVGCVVKIEPQPLLMVTEKNKTYALGDILEMNQNIDRKKVARRDYGFNP